MGQKQESETSKFGYSLVIVDDLITDPPEAPNKATLVGDTEQIVGIKEALTARGIPLHITQTGPHYLDICRAGVNKGTALRRLARYLKIPLTQVAAVGDYYNDMEMFAVAGQAVAMGDAPLEVQKAAHLVAPSSGQGGAVWTINHLIENSIDPAQAG
jgi:hydroxymethylpyrimidine pyrophosphatase-like HAD family hydrolase